MRRRRACGSATADYLGAVAAVALLMLALVALREHRPERRPAIDPVAHVARLLRPPPVARPRPATATRPRRPRAATRPRRPPPPRASVRAPVWAVGW